MAGQSYFGHPRGILVGAVFDSRQQLSDLAVHRPNQGGICGTATRGAESIVLSGGYEDDHDAGSVIIYTGAGGQDRDKGLHYADQVLSDKNKALAVSCLRGLPVRVVRGSKLRSAFSPAEGYRYDGLYRVASFWRERGSHGFLVWRYRLEAIGVQVSGISEAGGAPAPLDYPASLWTQRVVRSSDAALSVRVLHDDRCQVCGGRVDTPGGSYGETAWIRPLGLPHGGVDEAGNILCLCPNHHAAFDFGSLAVDAKLRIVDAVAGTDLGRLRRARDHRIDPANLAYRMSAFVPGS